MLTRKEFDNCLYLREDPAPAKAREQKSIFRTFWFVCVPLAAVFAFGLTLLSGEAGVFFPAWGVLSVILWGVGSLREKTNGHE